MPSAGRRFSVLFAIVGVVLTILFLTHYRDAAQDTLSKLPSRIGNKISAEALSVDDDILKGHAIAPKLGNETIKAELGRAAWKLFHTTFARFPDKPTAEESRALKTYIHLFQRLYPCGECAGHFRTILDKYPPQVSSRSAAAAWGCHVHNMVNKDLKKPMFDCSNIGDFYDCGCAEGEEGEDGRKQDTVTTSEKPKRTDLVDNVADGASADADPDDDGKPLEVITDG